MGNLAQESFEKFHGPVSPFSPQNGKRVNPNTMAGILKNKGYNSYRATTPASHAVSQAARASLPMQICGFNYQNDSDMDDIKNDSLPTNYRNSLFTS